MSRVRCSFVLLVCLTSCTWFSAVEGRREQLLATLDRQIAALTHAAESAPDKALRTLSGRGAAELTELRQRVANLSGDDLTRATVLGEEKTAQIILERVETDRSLLVRRDRILANASTTLARSSTQPTIRTKPDALADLQKLIDTTSSLQDKAIVENPSLLDGWERELSRIASALEGQEPDKVRQQKLRSDLERLVMRASSLGTWDDPARKRELERTNAQLDQLLKSVPDPEVAVLPTRERTRAELAKEEAAASVQKLEEDVRIISSPWFRVHAGAISVSPYVLRSTGSTPAYRLESVGSSTSFYAELDFHNRRAWLHPDERLSEATDTSAFWRALIPEDHEIRLRFVNGDGSDEAASASSDFNLEGSIGWSIQDFSMNGHEAVRGNAGTKLQPAGSINIEVNAGVATDRDAIDARRYIQAGLGSAWSFPIQVGDQTYRQATVFSGIYYGVHQFPRLEADDSVYTVAARPHFNDLGALGVKVDFTVPLSQNIDFVAGARYYTALGHDDVPDDWQLFLGVSVPIGKLLRSLSAEN